MIQVDLKPFVSKIQKAKQNIIKDIQKYTTTTFKRVFRPQALLKPQMLSGENRKAFQERLKLNKKIKGRQTGKYRKASDQFSPPRQDPRKYLSNHVFYINDPDSAIVVLRVPFGKQLDQGGNITVKQYATPYDWMRLDKIIYNGVEYFGRLLKNKKANSFGMKISQNARLQQTTKKNKITWFNKNKVTLSKRYSYIKQSKSINIKPRPFLQKVLNSVLDSGFIQDTLTKRLANINK